MRSSASPPTTSATRYQSEIPKDEIKRGRRLGGGCYGTVYEGEVFGSKVALKLSNKRQIDDAELESLRTEIRIMTVNPHPNVVQLIGACTERENITIVMELMEGNVFDLVVGNAKAKTAGPGIDLYDRVDMARQAALGMNRLHHNDPAIIHRDLKLENMLFKKQGDGYLVKVADFGLGALKPLHLAEIKESAQGTPLTRAPEIMKGLGFNTKADVYSFSMCLWSIVAQSELFPWHQAHSDYDQFKAAILGGERPPLESTWLPSLRSLLEDCWQERPDVRPSFDEVLKRLDNIIIEIAIQDEEGRQFWKQHYLQKDKVQWKPFARRLLEHLGLSATDMADAVNLLAKLVVDDDHVTLKNFGKVLKWFKGLATKDESFLHRVLWLMQREWFHGHATVEQTRVQLAGHPFGTFLVRFSSSSPGNYALSVQRNPQVVHTRILQDENGFYLEGETEHFASVEDLIEERMQPLGLIAPCPGSPYLLKPTQGPVYVPAATEVKS